uniref:Uncharacterized protein n=1 Tax=Knipowitschia caucasica TaxID=637954 RepID=A0AAV2IWA3_KNICA
MGIALGVTIHGSSNGTTHVYGYHPRQRVGSEAEGGCIPLMPCVMRVCHLRQGPSPNVHNLHGRKTRSGSAR